GRTVARQFDVLVDRLRPKRMGLDGPLFCDPIGIPAFHSWKHGEVKGGWRRGRRPPERARVPWIAGHIAKPLLRSEAHDELRDLTGDSNPHEDDACFRNKHPRIPGGDIVMLQAPRRTHEPHDVERHEGQIEADHPAPERGLPPALLEPEAESLREP